MKKLFVTLLLTAIFAGGLSLAPLPQAHGAALTPAGRLKRMSRMIRGTDPDAADYAALNAAIQKKQEEAFFNDKAAQYTSSPQNLRKMILRLDELFRFKTRINADDTKLQYYEPQKTANGVSYVQKTLNVDLTSSADILFKDIIQKNESWDDLLVSKNYMVPPPFIPPQAAANYDLSRFLTAPDNRFFEGIFSDLEDLYAPKAVTGNPHDPRLAGVLTTARFAARYTNTVVNKNRRRAAAVFRIFLCDDMKPSVQIDQGEMSRLIQLALQNNAVNAVEEAQAQAHAQLSDAQLHGNNPQCAACHYKLDPMGQAFSGMGAFLSDEPTPGRLVYRRADGTLVNVSGRGLGDVARAITQQPEYARCQVRHFLSWFMPQDSRISDQRLQELTDAFDQMGRKPDSFIAYLVNQPEFYGGTQNSPSASGIFATQVKPVFARCSQCHMAQGLPDFTRLPIGGNFMLNQTWISKIVRKLDLAHSGINRTMPPTTSGWDVTPAQLDQIRQWILQDAPDAAGVKSLAPDQGRAMLGGSR